MKKMVLLLLIFCFLVPMNVSAKTLGELKKELAELEQNQKKAESEKALTQDQINKTYQNIDSVKKQITSIEDERKRISDDLITLNESIEARDKEMKDIINFIQVSNGESAYLEYAFGAKDFTDFIYRVAVSEQLMSYNEELIKEYNDLIEKNNQRKLELNQKEIELDKAQETYRKELTSLGSKLNEVSDLKLTIAEEIKIQKEAIDMYQNKLGCKDHEDISICGIKYLPPGTAFYRPIVSGYVSSELGDRCYILNGAWKCDFHAGIDLATSQRAVPIYASAPGMVIATLSRTSCGGNQVFIHHNIGGVTYTTHYAHLLNFNVKSGDIVTVNTVIGHMGGDTSVTYWDGCSTGQHLHFSIAKGLYLKDYDWATFLAKQVNPRNYVNFPSGLYNAFENRYIKYN